MNTNCTTMTFHDDCIVALREAMLKCTIGRKVTITFRHYPWPNDPTFTRVDMSGYVTELFDDYSNSEDSVWLYWNSIVGFEDGISEDHGVNARHIECIRFLDDTPTAAGLLCTHCAHSIDFHNGRGDQCTVANCDCVDFDH